MYLLKIWLKQIKTNYTDTAEYGLGGSSYTGTKENENKISCSEIVSKLRSTVFFFKVVFLNVFRPGFIGNKIVVEGTHWWSSD